METYTEIIDGQVVTIKRYASGTRSSKKSKSIKELFPKTKRISTRERFEQQEHRNAQTKTK